MTNDTTTLATTPQLSVFLGEGLSENDNSSPKPLSSAEIIGPELMAAFESATGWTLRFQPVAKKSNRGSLPGDDLNSSSQDHQLEPVGVVEVDDMSAHLSGDERPIARTEADRLAESLSDLVGDRQLLRRKLANSRPPISHGELWALAPVEPKKFAKLMQQLLQSALRATDCERAAFYLLDDRSEFLELSGEVGLGSWAARERLLAVSPADVEALTGHTIVISEPIQSRIWAAPEDCYSAICVPVSSPNNVLGTLWVFSDDARKFSEALVGQIEIIAGRIAAELERESALAKLIAYRKIDGIDCEDSEVEYEVRGKDAFSAEVTVDDHSSKLVAESDEFVVQPPFDGWEFRGGTCETADHSIDWLVTDDEQIQLVLGHRDDVCWAHAFATIDPLSGEVILEGTVTGSQFWTLDWETLDLKPVDAGDQVLFLNDGQSLIATFCDKTTAVRDWIEASVNEKLSEDATEPMMLMLERGQF